MGLIRIILIVVRGVFRDRSGLSAADPRGRGLDTRSVERSGSQCRA